MRMFDTFSSVNPREGLEAFFGNDGRLIRWRIGRTAMEHGLRDWGHDGWLMMIRLI